ncbi:hypothetical protein H6P81_019915 [Aristolochia fimbriata]|uniref:Uncharacterized protein n=1 Tax=Aristolochia fimbriata TaxID=158543 RepID=A0AAV7DUV9_ARIFI|nr:hypothetical protein H6P81_019915 [Aristolochia fimbriata]
MWSRSSGIRQRDLRRTFMGSQRRQREITKTPLDLPTLPASVTEARVILVDIDVYRIDVSVDEILWSILADEQRQQQQQQIDTVKLRILLILERIAVAQNLLPFQRS